MEASVLRLRILSEKGEKEALNDAEFEEVKRLANSLPLGGRCVPCKGTRPAVVGMEGCRGHIMTPIIRRRHGWD